MMRTFDRVFCLILGLLFLALSAALLGSSLGLGHDTAASWLTSVFSDKLLSLLIFVITGAVAAYLFAMAFRSRSTNETIQYSTPLGDVRISIQAIEDLALRAAKKIRGVRDADIYVKQSQSGLALIVRIGVAPDVSIPEVSNELRTKLGSYIRDTAGMNIADVEVTVRKIAADVRSRVE